MKSTILALLLLTGASVMANDAAPSLPLNSRQWLDGRGMQWKDLKGKVVVLNVWTFACWNSYRSLPWLVSLQEKYRGLQIIGIHSPEFDYEKDRGKLKQTMSKYHIDYPQILDDDHEYWNRLDNRYWPSFYVVDKNGVIRGRFAGETHPEDSQAKEIETLIAKLQKE